MLFAVLGFLVLLALGSYSASAQKSNIEGLVQALPSSTRTISALPGFPSTGRRCKAGSAPSSRMITGSCGSEPYDGLYKYDGYTLKAYRHERGNLNSVANDYIRALYKGRDGSLWIGTLAGGLDRLDPSRDTFTHYPHQSRNPGSLLNDNVVCVYQDRRDELWVGTTGGLDRLEPASGTFIHYRHNSQEIGSLSDNIVERDL